MNRDVLEELPALAPLEFFTLEGQLNYSKAPPSSKTMSRKYMLPDTSEWLAEERFAGVALAWSEAGIYIDALVDKPFEEALYPKYQDGDAIELFFDTRDLKTAGFATRFCHQFVFLPQAVQGIIAQEVTHFRTEDVHPLCDAADLQVVSEIGKKNYELQIFIPAHCLHGFDPSSFERIGFTYRIHRYKGMPQHFALSSQHFSLEQHPRLWASFKFIK
ncbi:MAG: hypothetical protein JSS60_02295 [Verrucomicrobia bacterium]|nr:hypothetical protein [Verrucomicrobiota bacterium]